MLNSLITDPFIPFSRSD